MQRSRAATRTVLAGLAAVACAIAGLAVPAAAEDALPPDSSIPGWGVARSGSVEAAFTYEAEGQVGHALKIENRSPVAPNTFANLNQRIRVEPSTTYDFSAWVKSDGITYEGAQALIMADGGDWNQRFRLPAGTYDWQQRTWSVTTAAGQTSMDLRILTQDVTAGAYLDELTMVERGSTENLIVNGAFSRMIVDPLPHAVTFDGWTWGRSGGARGSVSSTAAGRAGSAVHIVNQTPAAPNTFFDLRQTVAVEPETQYTFTGWVRTEEWLRSTGALSIVLSNNWSERLDMPRDAYDWQQISRTFTTPAEQTTLTLRVLSQDLSEGVYLDDFSLVQAGTESNLLTNGVFESHSRHLGLANETLLFDPGQARLDFVTNAPDATSVSWTIKDVRGVEVASGSTGLAGGAGSADVSDLGHGFFVVEASSTTSQGELDLRASFATVPVIPEEARTGESAFGVGIHGYDPLMIEGIARLGFAHVRHDAPWHTVELSPGVYTFPAAITNGFGALHEAGLEPLPISNYRNPLYDDNRTPSSPEGLAAFGAYTAALNAHLGEFTDSVEVYNEFNINFNDGLCGRTPQCYAQMLAATAPQVKEANPDAVIVGPAISGASVDYVTGVLEAGGAGYLDAISVHPYRHPSAPEGMDTQMADLASAIESAAGRSIPIWLTEYGWPTDTPVSGITDAIQADYLVRSAALLLAGGVERLYWYVATDSGTDPADQIHNFGLFEAALPQTVNARQPKPAGVAQAVLSANLGGLDYSGRDGIGADAHSIVFGDGGDRTRVMWAPDEAVSVRIDADGPVQVTDQYGASTELIPQDGRVYVALTERPVYVSGAITGVVREESPTVVLVAPQTVAQGEVVEIRAVIDRTGAACEAIPAELQIVVEGVERTLLVDDCSRGEAVFEVTVPQTDEASWITGSVAAGGRPFATLATQAIEVTEAVDAEIELELVGTANGGFEQRVTITVRNRSSLEPVPLTDIVWELGGESGTIAGSSTLDPGGTISHTFALPGLELWRHDYLDVRVGIADGAPLELRQSVGIAPIEADGQTTLPPIDLESHASWHRYNSDLTGPEDLSGTARITEVVRDEMSVGLRFQADIVDDVHRQANPPGGMYNGDSVQLSFSPAQPGASNARTEIGLARGPDGQPGAYTFASFGIAITGNTPVEEGSLSVTRDEDAKLTSYDVILPWEALGVNAENAPSGTFAFSFLVNDDDGETREGFIEWSSGIGITKNTGQHFPVQLVGAAEAPVVDTSALEAAIMQAEALSAEEYTAQSWGVLQATLDDAREALTVGDQEAVDAATAALLGAIDALVPAGSQPTPSPTAEPTGGPTGEPTAEPTGEPSSPTGGTTPPGRADGELGQTGARVGFIVTVAALLTLIGAGLTVRRRRQSE